MPADFSAKVALVTGASRGIGASVARMLADRGVRLGLASRAGDDLGIEGAVARPTDVRDRSQLVALAASWHFIRLDATAAIGVYLLDAIAFAGIVTVYAYVAPPGGGMGAMVWAAFLIGQAYIVGRLSVRLLFFASEIALFQGRHD